MYQEVCFNQGTEAGEGGVNAGHSLSPPSHFMLATGLCQVHKFSKRQLESSSIVLKFFHSFLFLYSLCYSYLLFMFCGEVIFMFLSEFGGGSQCLKCVKFRHTAPFSVLL